MSTSPKPRNLVVCVDGTSNKFSDKNTNVVKLYDCLKKDDSQKTYYSSGIGTFPKPSRRFVAYIKKHIINTVDLMVAKNLEIVILDAYRWLADVYQPDDRIFLFGFSRGAYQVRALAAMIESVGLIHAGNQKQIPFAWELYKTKKSVKQKHRGMVEQFKATFSRDVEIYFLGAWDTVSSVGLYRRRLLPSTRRRDYIEHFRHALALDERRVKFLPEYVMDSSRGINTSKNVWFIGSHSDIGGMKSSVESESGAEPLIWMMDEAKQVGLKLRCQDVHARIPPATTPKGLKFWWIVECLPVGRVRFKHNNEAQRVWWPHLGQGRRMLIEHKLHWTVFAGLQLTQNSETPYKPRTKLKRENDTNLALSEIVEGGPALDPDDFCEGTNRDSKLAVLKSLQHINDIYSRINIAVRENQPNKPEQTTNDTSSQELIYSKLKELLKFARSGQADIIWIYGGPKFLYWAISLSIGVDKIMEVCTKLVNAVVDPRSQVQWEADLKRISESSDFAPEGDDDSDELDEVVLPRLCNLLRYCHDLLEPLETKKQPTSGYGMLKRLMESLNSRKTGNGLAGPAVLDANDTRSRRLTCEAAGKLALIALEMADDTLDQCQEIEHNRKEVGLAYIKEFPLFLLSPPSGEERFPEELYQVARETIEISARIAKNDRYRQELSCEDIVKKLLPWFRHWESTPREITTGMINLVGRLAEDPIAVAFLVHERFLADIMGCFAKCGPEEEKKQQEALSALLLLTQHSHDPEVASKAVPDDAVHRLISLMKTTPSADAINVLANLTKYDQIRKKILKKEAPKSPNERTQAEVLTLLFGIPSNAHSKAPSTSSSDIDYTGYASEYDDDTEQSLQDTSVSGEFAASETTTNSKGDAANSKDAATNEVEVAKASIRLTVELAKHEDSKKELVEHQGDIFDRLVIVLQEEHTEQTRWHKDKTTSDTTAVPPGPIAEQVFGALSVFVLNNDLMHPKLVRYLEKLSRSYGPSRTDYSWKVYLAIQTLLERGKDNYREEGDKQGSLKIGEWGIYDEAAKQLVSTLVRQASAAKDLSDPDQASTIIDAMTKILEFTTHGIFSPQVTKLLRDMMTRAISLGNLPENKSTEKSVTSATNAANVILPQCCDLIESLLKLPDTTLFANPSLKGDWRKIVRLMGKLTAPEFKLRVISDATTALLPKLQHRMEEARRKYPTT